ncbi:M15 family metallopeptidase [Rhodoblastus sp.]|uniref:M15 family metallopeptidase n=1 Tax=Rhodoblastus sp. TaxID=1962975 RepID=UPI003F95CC9F
MTEVSTNWPLERVADLNAFYGDPRGSDGSVGVEWYHENMDIWSPPYPMFYSDGKHTPLHHLSVHKKCLVVFDAAFKDVLETLGHDYIVEKRLNISGGSFCYRLERGGSRLSVHSWGCAIDMDPQHNPFPHHWVANRGFIDMKFVGIMQRHGFDWRGDLEHHDIDPMHFQLCRHVF